MQIAVGIPPHSGASPFRITRTLILSAFVAALGGLLFGFDTAVIAGATRSLTAAFSLSPATLGITVSSVLWGTVIGALIGGAAGERFGRRDSLRAMALLYLLSALGCAVAWNWSFLLTARIVGGLGIGGSFVLGPMYIAEISPARLRGRMVGFFQFNVVAGILLAYFSNYFITLVTFSANQWRWQLGAPAVPSAMFLFLLLAIPRSPRWLVEKRRYAEARDVLARIGEVDPQAEVNRILESIESEMRLSGEKLFSRSHRLPVFLAVTIAVFCQLSGINAVLYYLNDIFSAAGASAHSTGLQTIAVGATNLFFTSLAMLVIDRIGRRALLLVGSVGMCAALSGIAMIFHTQAHRGLLVWLLIAYCASFSFSLGAVVWVYISEVFSNGVRTKGQTLGSLTQWLMNALVAVTFPVVAARSNVYPFLFFAAMMVVQFFVILFIYPETKNVALEDMRLKPWMNRHES